MQCILLQLNWGGDVPEEYFMSNIMENKKGDMETSIVGRGSTFQLEVEIELPGTAIRFMRTSDQLNTCSSIIFPPLLLA